jgi:PAS domain S-box-containing protein
MNSNNPIRKNPSIAWVFSLLMLPITPVYHVDFYNVKRYSYHPVDTETNKSLLTSGPVLELPLASEGSVESSHSLPLLLALILGGLAGIYVRYPIFFNLNFLFGSLFAMLALQFLGLRRGLVAALVISSYTYFLWNHPYGIVIMTAEVAFVGWLVTRRKMGMVLADTLFWLCLGMPLAFFFYHQVMGVPTSHVNITIVKQALNGIANALIARLLFTGHSLRSQNLKISSREILYNLMAVFVLFPALILLAVSSRSDFVETDRSIRSSLLRDSRRVSSTLDHWLNARRVISVSLAELAATLPPQQMQARLEQARASDLYLMRIGLHDKDAVVIAHAPLTDEAGGSNLGKSFADRPFLPALKRKLKPMLSEMVLGKIDPLQPRALMLAPVLVQGEYAGYIAGVLNLDRVRGILDENAGGMLYTLLDGNGKIILTNHKDQQLMTPLVRGKGMSRRFDDGIDQWVPALPAGTPTGELWRQSRYVKKSSVGTFAEWDLVLEQPVEPFQKALYDRYTDKLGLLFLIFVGALTVAEILSRQIHASLLRLRTVTRDLPARLAQGQQVSLPESPVLELHDLVDNFKEMTGSLTARFAEIREFNETLELRVAERTEELSSLNRDFVSFLENTSDFIYFKDADSRFRFCSQTLASITGHASWRDMIGKHDREVFPEDLARTFVEEELPVFRDGNSLINKTNPYFDAQGRQGWISTNKWPVFGASGKVVGLFGISRDITEITLMQESLRLARQSLDQVPDPVVWVGLEGRIIDCNEVAYRRLGYSKQELFETSIFAIDPSVTAATWSGFFAELRQQKFKHFESVYRTKGGGSIPMDVQVTHISFAGKEYLCGVARDIGERKAMEDRLRKSEANLNRAQSVAKLGSWEWDPASGQVVYSGEICTIFGIDRDHCTGGLSAILEDLIYPEDRELVLAAKERARQTGVGQTVEYRFRHPDGSLHWIRAIGEFIREPGRPVTLMGAVQDITVNKRLEQERLGLERQVLHVQKLESLGIMSGGIAHDFNNLLQVVLGNLDLSLMILPEEATVRRNLEQAVIATVRASELSGMMLAYSGKGILATKKLNLSDLLRENGAVLSAATGNSAPLKLSLHHSLPPVQADATQLLQVVMNLISNSSEAIDGAGGSITLATGVAEFDQISLNASKLEEKLPAGRYVWAEVRDTGCGMDETTQYKIFDPFFSTKFTGRGLGMSAALGIMRAHQGAIMLESTLGAGTSIRLLFPVAADPQQPCQTLPEGVPDAPAAAGERDTILIVDDEEMIRTLSVAMLEAFGYETLVATDGEKALEIFRSEGSRISLVLLDQSMPTMDGLEVFKQMRRIRPEVKVLLASGFSEQEVSARYRGLGLNGFIQKPFNTKHLSDEVLRILQQT